METKKPAKKQATKKAAATAKKVNVSRIPVEGDLISPIPSETKNGLPVVFEVYSYDEATEKVFIKPGHNFYEKNKWEFAPADSVVNF